MDNRLYRSGLGEVKTYEAWKQWAISFYTSLEEKEFADLPDNWFKRITKVLKLEDAEIADRYEYLMADDRQYCEEEE